MVEPPVIFFEGWIYPPGDGDDVKHSWFVCRGRRAWRLWRGFMFLKAKLQLERILRDASPLQRDRLRARYAEWRHANGRRQNPIEVAEPPDPAIVEVSDESEEADFIMAEPDPEPPTW